eukprot:scaffold1318_cov388-Prasinococcus_capsulatus_cf.AAC.3
MSNTLAEPGRVLGEGVRRDIGVTVSAVAPATRPARSWSLERAGREAATGPAQAHDVHMYACTPR